MHEATELTINSRIAELEQDYVRLTRLMRQSRRDDAAYDRTRTQRSNVADEIEDLKEDLKKYDHEHDSQVREWKKAADLTGHLAAEIVRLEETKPKKTVKWNGAPST